jgi:SPP1 family predicted phage head-tail adaptor
VYNELIEFGSIHYTKNAAGQEIEEKEWREVYAKVLSVKRTEFYAAAMANIRPECVFRIPDRDEYRNEKVIRYKGVTYDVIRTYGKPGEKPLEITAEMRERDGNRTRGED